MRTLHKPRHFRHFALAAAVVASFVLGGTVTASNLRLSTPGQAPMTDAVGPVQLPAGVTPNAVPANVPGSRWLVTDIFTVTSRSLMSDSNIRLGAWSGAYWYAYANGATDAVHVPLALPAGARVYRIDVYGYRSSAGSQSWVLLEMDPTTGAATASSIASPSGTGLVHGSISYAGNPLPAGRTWLVGLYGTSESNGYVGAIVQYKLPTNVYVPINPVRVFDSRFASGGAARIVRGAPKTIAVKDAISFETGTVVTPNAIPAGATAVTYNLTVTGTVNSGWAALLPGASTTVTTSSINWVGTGTTIANGGVVQLGTGGYERKITIVVGGGSATYVPSAHVIVDITGYYASES